MLDSDHGLRTPVAKRREKVERAGGNQLRLEHANLPHKTISTLNGNTENLTYAGNLETGISGVWGSTVFAFDSDFLHELLANCRSAGEVGLRASMTGSVNPDTPGFWIDEHYPSRPRRYASALGAIFVAEGVAERGADRRKIRLRFF